MEIIGVDHVQFAVRDVVGSAHYLARHGYQLQFAEPDFNMEARSYFRGVKKSMAYLRYGASRLEVINGTEHQRHASYIPVFDGRESLDRRPAYNIGEFCAFWHEGLSSVCASKSGKAAILDEVIVRASCPDRSAAFWQSLGFELISRDDRWYKLAFPRNMLSMPLTILLARTQFGHCDDPRADDLGCSSIALITRDLQADRLALGERYRVSEATSFHINRRLLTICFASGPSGELIELVELGRV